jgi:hypothetical protein
MGQFVHNGILYEEMPNGQARVIGPAQGAQQPAFGPAIGGNPLIPGQIQGQAQTNEKTAELTPLEVRKAKADAQKAEIDARTAQEAYDAAHPKTASAGTLFGPDYLKTLPGPDQELVKALAEGRLAFPGGFALKAPWWQQKLEQVAQYDPSFDATNFNNRAKARAMLLTGKVGGSANALNTAIGHLGLLSQQIGGVASHNFTPFNSVENALSQTFGSAGVTNFKDTAKKLADELESVYRNGGGTEQGVMRQLQSLDPNASLEQKQGIIRNALELLASKQAANLYQYGLAGGKPPVDLLDPAARKVLDQFPDIRDKYFGQPDTPLSGNAAAILAHNGGTPPSAPPPAPGTGGDIGPHLGPQPPSGPQSLAQMDPNSPLGVFKQTYRNVPDQKAASALDALAHQGGSFEQAAKLVGDPSFTADDWKAYSAYAQSHPGYHNATVLNRVPTTIMQRLASSPAGAFVAGAATGGTAGLSDVAGRTLAGPEWDANRQALAGLHPGADILGNVAGGAAGMFGGGLALRGIAPAVDAARAAKIAPYLPRAADAAYGATYGASEDPSNPLAGATEGALTGVGSGMLARGAIRAIASTIAPTGGNLAPIFNVNPDFRPTIGQRLSASDSRLARAVGMGEQAAESIPALGGIQTSARSAATDQMQRGAYNHALSDLAPFNPILGRDVSQLPQGVTKGAQANDFLHTAMSDAQEHARAGMQFAADPQYQQDVGVWQRNPDGMSLTTDQQNHVRSAIAQAMHGRMNPDGTMAGPDYGAAASDLGRVARNWSGNPSTAPQAAYLRDYLSIMDEAAKRNSPPEASALLDAANRGYAKSVIIENAAKAAGGEPTEFTGKQLLKAVQSSDPSVRDRAFISGQALMQPYAMAASKLAPSLADSGTPQRLAWMRGIGGTGEAAALGAAAHFGGPMGAVPASAYALDTIANLPGIRNVVGAAMAPRDAILPPPLADATNLVGKGLYKRANRLGMFAAPLALSYFDGQ